jgi:DNA-binding MurR/RpiR family transcriptional regulator
MSTVFTLTWPDMQAKGATLVSITSVAGCKLESVCDLAVVLPLVRDMFQHSGLWHCYIMCALKQ